jgi:anti-sigma B factor antagonist
MTIDGEDLGGVRLLRLHGQLTSGEPNPLVETMTELLTSRRACVLLDLAGVEYINSAGLGDLVRLVAQANIQEARVILVNLSAYLAGVLEMTKLDRFFEICPNVDEALRRLGR